MNVGRQSLRPDLHESVKEEIAWEKIQEVDQMLEWGITEEIDNVTYDPSLAYQGKEAQTRRKPTGEIEVAFGDHFFQDQALPDYVQDIKRTRTALHEMIHVSDFAGRIEQDLKGWNADKHFIEEFSTDPLYRPESETEALTEITVDELLEYDIGSAYPYWKRRKEKELERRGVDPSIDPDSGNPDTVIDGQELGGMNVLYEEEAEDLYRQLGEIDGDFYMIEIRKDYESDEDAYEEDAELTYEEIIGEAIQIANDYLESLEGAVRQPLDYSRGSCAPR